MPTSYLTQGAIAAETARRRMQKTGCNFSGHPLWTRAQDNALRRLYGTKTYVEIAKVLGRSYHAVRNRAQALGLAPSRHTWTGAEILRLRKVWTRGTKQEIEEAFPGFSLNLLGKTANRHGFYRPRRPLEPTGILAYDRIRERATELGYTMADIDALARTGRHFTSGLWGSPQHPKTAKIIARAVAALDGELDVTWH